MSLDQVDKQAQGFEKVVGKIGTDLLTIDRVSSALDERYREKLCIWNGKDIRMRIAVNSKNTGDTKGRKGPKDIDRNKNYEYEEEARE